MESKKQPLFDLVEPGDSLKISILNKIKREEVKKTIYKIVFSSVLSFFSISVAFIYAINVIKDFYQSGLSEYFSLIFSDGASLVTYWQSYIMSIVESLPIIPITILVASIGIFIWSINVVLTSFKNTRSIFYKVN
jgi:hypothetical protein